MKSARHPLQLVLGPTVWLVWFNVVYGGVSLACAVAAPAARIGPFNGVNGAFLLLTAVTAAGLAWASWRCWRESRAMPEGERVLPWSAALLHAISSASTLVVGVPLLVVPPCV